MRLVLFPLAKGVQTGDIGNGCSEKLINAEKSDLFDVLEYVSFAIQPIKRE